MSQASDRIVERIRKLFALAAQNSNVNEAAAATARAQQLLFEHKLSMADLDAGEDEDAVGRLDIDEETSHQLKWKQSLMAAIAHGCYCKCITAMVRKPDGKRISRLILIGKASDTRTAAYLYEYARGEIDRLCAIHAAGRGFRFANSFRLGACAAIDQTLSRKRAQQEHPFWGGNALAVIRRGEGEIDAFIVKAFEHVGDPTPPKVEQIGFAHGMSAGAAIRFDDRKSLSQGSRSIADRTDEG